MARKRSAAELWELARYANSRVASGRGGALSSAVVEKALDAERRIERTKSYQRLANKSGFARTEVDRYNYMTQAMSRKYSPSTYKGMSNG
jgi:CRISPR/Cas system type I-B associated protein Csh2 (Cas7 group RAMP superfamily)